MTKTITQLQPFIYDVILTHPRRSRERRCRTVRLLRGIALGLYVILGLRVTADTGLAPWDAGFWAILVPLYVLGEWTLRELSRWLLPPAH
jgi:hypothetical protein